MAQPKAPHPIVVAPDEKLTPEKKAKLAEWNAYNNPNGPSGQPQPQGAPWGYNPEGTPLGPNGGMLVNRGLAFPGAGFFNDPSNIAQTYETYKDDAGNVPDWLDWGGVEAAYRYMQATQGQDSSKWMWLNPQDPANSFLSGLGAPPTGTIKPYEPIPTEPAGADWTSAGYKEDGTFDIAAIPVEQRSQVYNTPGFDITQYDPATREAMLGDPAFPWENLPDWQKTYYSIISNPKIMASPLALAGAKAGGIAGPIGNVIGGIGGYLLGIVGGKEYDPTGDFEDQPSVAAKGMYLLNRLSEASEQAVGYTAQLSDAALAGLQGNEQAAEAAKKMVFDKQYRSAAWEAGRMVYEYADTPLKNLAPIMFSFAQVFNKKNWDKKIGLPELAGPGEDYVIGQAEPVKRDAEMGTNPLTGETRLVTDSMGMLQEARLAILEAYEQGASADDVRGVIREMMGEASQFVGSQVQDLAFQTIFDPLNVVDDYSGKAAGAVIEGVAKVNPELAARLTANPELMATMLRTGKGVIEPMTRRWGELVRSGAVGMVDDLTAFDRMAGGLDAEGRVKGLSPDKPKNFLQYLTTMTPESKARTAVYTMSDNLKAMLLDASPDDFLRAFNVAATGDLKAARDMGAAFLGSPESYTFLPILKDFQQRAGGLLDLWKQGDVNGNRSALLKVGQILGENPGEVLKRFLDGDAKPDFERLVDAARRSDDPAAREFVAEVEAGRITAEGLVNDFGIFKQVPYHPDEWKAMVYDAFMEHVAERVTDIYKLAPDSKFFQSIKTLKGVQSLLLLSLSPSYLINNVMNNAATMAADGLFGFVPPWKVDEWMNRFGLEPTRLKQGIGAIGDTSKVETGYGKTVEGIFKRPEAKTPEDILGDATKATGVNASVQRVIGSVNRKVGIFASLSGKMEAVQSKQAFSTAMRKFWGNVWNRGKGFDTMPAALESGLRQAGIDPNTIYTAIESGMNWKDVEGVLRGSEKLGARYQVSNYINRAAESLGMTPADARNLLGAVGVLDELESTIARAKDNSQIASAFAAVERKSQRWIDAVSAQELRGMAEANAQRVQTEGYAGAHDIFVEQFQRLEKRWVDNYVEWEAAHAMAQAATDQASKSAIYRAQRERSISNWRRYFEYEAATWKGISDAFGMTDEKGRKFLAGIADYQKENQTFFREYADAVNEHFNKIFDTREQAIADWNALVDEYDAKWKDVTINKNKVWMGLDEQLAGWFEDKYGTQAGADARKWLKNKADFHDEMTLTMRQFRDSTKYLPAEPKRAAWMKFVAEEYVPMIKTFTDIAHGGAADTYAGITGRPKGPGPAAELFTAENTTRVQEINHVAEAHAASVWEVAAKYGVYGLDDAGTPVKNANLNLIKTVKKWGGGEGGYIRTFQDITPTLLDRALTNRAEWEKMQAEFDASVLEPAPKTVETTPETPPAPIIPDVPSVPIDPLTQKRTTVLEGIQRRTIDTLPEPVRDGITRALKAMEDEVQAEHGESLLAWLRKRGGLSKQYLADLTGETRIRKEWGPGVFTNRTGTQYALDTIAREAADYGYLTPDKLADDGGVGAITDLLQRELSGEKVYPVGTEALPEWYKGLRAGGDKKATALAAIDRVRTGTDAVKYGGKATATELAVKEEAFARLANEASYDARLSELTGWPFDDSGLRDAIDGIEGRYDPNNLDALRSLETEINDQLANLPEAVDDATLTRLLELNSKVAESIDIHTMRADAEAVISNAELRADAEMNRRVHHERLIEAFGLTSEQADAQVAVLDGVSEYWAKLTGRDASEWWGEFVRDVRRGEAGEAERGLQQGYYRADLYHVDNIRKWFNETTKRTDWVDDAVNHFGLTTNINEAGWILPDGRMLDFSGKRDGGQPNTRSMDHRDISQVVPGSQGSNAMIDFAVQTGSVRFSIIGADVYVDMFNTIPTDAQISAVKRAMRGMDGLTWDIDDARGNTILSGDYKARPAFFDRVINDARRIFEGTEDGQTLETAFHADELFQGAKASISFDVDSKAVITAFEAADFSSSIHEHAHIFLPMLDRMANEGFGSLAKTDLAAVRKWMTDESARLNAERTAGNLSADQVSALFVDADGKATDTIMPFDEAGNYTRAGQELFARGFERYIADGFAPTVALGKVFAAFKDWMLKIYRSITGSGIDVNLTPDVRDVFDRLVSGDPDLNRVDLTPSASKVEVYKAGDIVRLGDGVQATVTEVRPNGDLRLDNGRVVSRVSVGRVAEQENMFGDMGMQAGPDAQQTSLFQNTPDNPVYPPGGYEEATGYYPTSRVQDEAWAEQVRPLLDAMRDAALKPENAGPDYMNIPDEAAQSFKRYMQTVKNQMTTAKRATVAYGESARDFALLPYHKQYGFDKLMQVGFPYQFFTTRTMMNWALRAMDKPGMLATYSRLKRFQNQQESNLPERLRDKVWMAMPFLPEWAGGGTWINPNPALFPFENLLSPLKSFAQNRMYEANNATYIIQRWVDEGKVTQSAAQDALQSQTGATWERAIKAAQAEGGENPMDYFTMLYGPALYATLPYYLATGKKAGASGWPSSPLPITRTGKALETAFKGTGLEWIGDTVGGALQAPEKWGREQLGLNEFGEWGDFYVDRQLANMAAEGEYSSQEVRQAMIERSGPIYDAALERVNMEHLAKTPGALPLYGAAHGARLDQVLGSILPSMFSGGLLPEGELDLKGLKGEYNLAWESYKTGDKEALTKFFDAYPEYEARLALRDEPDERLRNFLTSEIWDRYMALGKTYRKQAGQALGDEFGEFLGNSTELTDSLPIEKLARWAQVLGGMVPKVEETAPVIEEPQTINWYNEAVQGTLDTFYSERDTKFPNYWFIQSGYFGLPQSKRAQYLMKFPELKEYWDWKDGWEQRYPDMQPYFSGEVFKDIDTTGWPEPLVYQATIYALTGTRMTSGMESWLEQVWIGMGRPYGSLDAWMNIDVSPALRTRISGMGSQVIPQP